ncbi:protein of unknown function [Algoriphagus faecimaris]|uniref:Uncharacterized protein n=1 Tax=Algoriphagus faecimaris TaxID=686796 RepID=A0A1G6R568_9BACT|nr:DUF748 domain-containing protein [Algoriphagus faecimaris]SDC99698.1 protein of unknown function [Algoriphagus faecimaris]
MIHRFKEKLTRHPLRKKILRVLTFIFLGILFLEFVIYFGSNLLLVNWTRNKINEATAGVYQVDFNRLNFSLIRRGVFLNGIVMKPVEANQSEIDQVVFDFTLDEIAFRNIWYDWSERIIRIGKIDLDNPDIGIELPEKTEEEGGAEKKTPVKRLEEEIQKSIERISMGGVYIDEIEINHADLFFLNFLSQKSLKAENSRVLIRDVDWTTAKNWETPFNAAGFEFELEQVEFPLSDGVHLILAENVHVSSLDRLIDIQEFQLISNRAVPSRSYYDLKLDRLKVANMDLNRAFLTSEVKIEEIVLNDPEFQMTSSGEKLEEEVSGSGDLNGLIEGILKSFSIKEFSVNNGKFSSRDLSDSARSRVDIADVDFRMAEFYLGADESQLKNQFFYGKDAAMELGDFTLSLSDGVHVIRGEKVSMSSFLDEIEVENFEIFPKVGDHSDTSIRQVVRLSLPKLQLNEANLKKLYNESKLDVDLLEINQPKVEFIDRVARKDTSQRFAAQKLLQGYLEEVNIRQLKINEGTVRFENESGDRSDNIGFEKFSLELEDVLLRPESSANLRDLLLAEEMVLSLDQYQLKLRDNLHLFTADKIVIDSKRNLVDVRNFSLKPEKPDQIQELLDIYDKSATIDLSVPVFQLNGIDVRSALLEGNLLIDYIMVSEPHLIYNQYRKRNQESETSGLSSSGEIQDLLSDYFQVVSIDSIAFFKGKMDFTDITGRQEVSFSEEDLSLKVRDFYYAPGQEVDLSRSFFSDEIILNLAGYSFSLAKGDYDVSTGNLQFNTKTEAITIDSLLLTPGEQLESKLALSLLLPKLTLEGVDLEEFLYENRLDLTKLTVEGSRINLDIEPDFIRNVSKQSQRGSRALSRSVEYLKIEEISALESDLRLTFQIANKEVESIQATFDVAVTDFFLDEQMENELILAELFDEVSLAVNDFSFVLPDSLHRVRFSEVFINNKADETVFSGLEIEPLDLENAQGTLFSGKIDELGIQNNTLAEIQRTGKVNLEGIRFLKPEFVIYLDSTSTPKEEQTTSRIRNEEAFVSSLILQNLSISDGKLDFHRKGIGPLPRLQFQGIDFSLADLDIDLLDLSKANSSEFFLDEDLRLSISDYQIYSKDSLEVLRVKKASVSERNLILEGVQFSPAMGRYEYLRKVGFQTDAIQLGVDRIAVESINTEKLISGQGLEAKRVHATGMHVDVLRDKRIPQKEGVIKLMPQEIFQDLPFNVRVDSILVEDGFVRYQEFVANSMSPGKIEFENLEVVLTPFAISDSTTEHPIAHSFLLARSALMGSGELDLQVQMHYAPPYEMEVTVQVDRFDLTQINDMLSKGAFLEINSGEVLKGDWNFRLDKEEAFGRMDFRYEGLKVTFLDSVTLEKGRGKLGLMTFLANTLIKNNNPRKFLGNVVRSDIYLKRDQSKFIFNAWWKATLTGLKGSVGLGQPQLPVRRKEDEE